MNDKEYIEYFKEYIKSFYSLPENTKIAIFQNPKKFNISFIEDINPTHIKLIYGRHWFNKGNCEKIAKIIIPSMIISEIMILSYFLTNIYLNVFGLSLLFGYYVSNLYTLFDNVKSFYGVFDYGICRKYCDRDLW